MKSKGYVLLCSIKQRNKFNGLRICMHQSLSVQHYLSPIYEQAWA
jgi:hypothetical protein